MINGTIIDTISSFASSGVLGIIFVVIMLVIAVVIGVFRKTFMQIWDVIVFAALFIVSYFVLMPKLGCWISDKFMAQFGLNSTVVVSGIDVYEINSFSDLIAFVCRLTVNAKYTADYSYNLAHSITYAMALAVLMFADLIVAPILSLITWPIVKLAVPKKWDFANKRFVGPIVSALEVVFALVVIINCYNAYSEGMVWIINNPYVLSKMNVPTTVFDAMKFFVTDFFGVVKYLGKIPLFNFQFTADGVVYTTSKEFYELASVTFPEGADASALSDAYKARLLELWAAENGVSYPTAEAVKASIRKIFTK